MEYTNINDLKVGQHIWYFSKYGALLGGKIYELRPNNPHPCGKDFGVYDEVMVKVLKTSSYNGEQFWSNCGICAKQTMIHTSKPTKNEFVDDSVEFEHDCHNEDCNGTIRGNGWCNDDGEITSFGYQECDGCGWNQAS